MSVFPPPGTWRRGRHRTRQNESAGRVKSSKTRPGNRYLKGALGTAALSAARSKNTCFSAKYKRIAARRGPIKAVVAVEHAMLIAAFNMLTNGGSPRSGADYYTRHVPAKTKARAVSQLETLGCRVSLQPSPIPHNPTTQHGHRFVVTDIFVSDMAGQTRYRAGSVAARVSRGSVAARGSGGGTGIGGGAGMAGIAGGGGGGGGCGIGAAQARGIGRHLHALWVQRAGGKLRWRRWRRGRQGSASAAHTDCPGTGWLQASSRNGDRPDRWACRPRIRPQPPRTPIVRKTAAAATFVTARISVALRQADTGAQMLRRAGDAVHGRQLVGSTGERGTVVGRCGRDRIAGHRTGR